MAKKYFILYFILLVGFIFVPTNAFACGSKSAKTEKSCCKKSSLEKKCCSKSNSGNKEKGCNGKCGHSDCSISSAHSFILIFNTTELNFKPTDLYAQKVSFTHVKKNILSGFVSLWLIPKIS